MTRAALLAAVLALVCAAPAAAAPELVKVGDFDAPVHVAIPPDNSRVFVVEQGGLVKDLNGTVALDLRHLTSGGGERGLLSIAFPPDHATTGLVYAFLTTPGADYDLRVVELPSERIVLSIPHPGPDNHNGGQLQFGPDGYLYVGTGDGGGGNDPDRNAQDLTSELGKILRIDPRTGAAAPGNPFGTRVWSYGLRNPWRFSFDLVTGRLMIGDVGQGAWEEVNAGDGRGVNYGWPCFEGRNRNPAVTCDAPGAAPPLFERSHGDGYCSIVGGYVARGPDMPSLYGRYLYGDLCLGTLRSTSLEGGDDRAEPLPISRLTSFGQDSCGRLYVASHTGPVYRIQEGAPPQCTRRIEIGDPPGPAPDVVAPRVSVQTRGLRSAVRRRRLQLRVRCDEACRVVAGGRLRGVGRLRTARRDLAAADRTTVTLRMSRKTARSLRRVLRRRGRVIAALRVVASDGAGNASRVTRRAKVRR